jgi:hypothetical protein
MADTRTRRVRLAAARLLDRVLLAVQPADRIPGSHPVYVRRTGLGCELAVDSLVEAVVLELMTEIAEDPKGVADEAAYLLATDGPERDVLMEKLVDRLGGATLRLGETAVQRLRDRLTDIGSTTPAPLPAPIPFPKQSNRRAA